MKRLVRILIVIGAVVLVLGVLPFALPVAGGGVDPASLIDDPAGRFVTPGAVRLYVEERGPVEGPAMLFIHGLFGSTESWRRNVDALAAAGYRVITYDRPGFGLSDKPEAYDYSVTHQADEAAALLDALGIDRAVIVGHSAGGNVASFFADRHPERVERLVLVDAAVLAGGPPPFVGRLVALPPVWRWGRVGLNALFTRERLADSLRGFYADPATLSDADLALYWRAFQTAGWDIGLLGLTRDATPGLGEARIRAIAARTLLLWGADDRTTPLAQGETLDEWIPDSTLVTIPGAGHQPFEEAPDAFNNAILSFASSG